MTAHILIDAARALSAAVDALPFAAPVTHVYNPLDYAWEVHRRYLETYGAGRKRVVFVGMNPGPFGMAQIGVPFGEIASARDWLGHAANDVPALMAEVAQAHADLEARRTTGSWLQR